MTAGTAGADGADVAVYGKALWNGAVQDTGRSA